MATVTCSICTTTNENPPVNGLTPDMPNGWSMVTIAERGWHIRNFTLCRACTTAVRAETGRLGNRYRDGLEVSDRGARAIVDLMVADAEARTP